MSNICEALFLPDSTVDITEEKLFFLEFLESFETLISATSKIFKAVASNNISLDAWHISMNYEAMWEAVTGRRSSYCHLVRHLVEIVDDGINANLISAENIEVSQKRVKHDISNCTHNSKNVAAQIVTNC